MLFSKLDTAQDGLLDELELEALFSGYIGSKNNVDCNIDYLEDTEQRENINRYMRGGYGTYNKRPLDKQEIYDLPRFNG